MPNFSDYLLAPWKFFGLLGALLTTARPGAGASASIAMPAGSFCANQDIGGQVIYVCRALGYEMPGFVFWASLLILALFALAAASLILQCTTVTRGLTRIVSQLEKVPRPGKRGDQNQHINSLTLSLIRKVMQKQRITEHSWLQFEDTLLISGEGTEVYTTEPVDAVFSKASLVEQNVHGAFFAAVPGILTGVGLLMTFVAILDGLSHVTVAANMDVQGIGGLINGLSGKFVSSIVAVTCAVSFVLIERFAYSLPERAHRKMLKILGSLFRRRTTEHLLYEILNELRVAETERR